MITKFILLTFGDNDFYQEFYTIGNIVMEYFYNNKFNPNLASNLFLMFPNLVAGINSLSLSSYNAKEKFSDLREYIIDNLVYLSDNRKILDFIESKLLLSEHQDKGLLDIIRKQGCDRNWICDLKHLNCNSEILLFQFNMSDAGLPLKSSDFCII